MTGARCSAVDVLPNTDRASLLSWRKVPCTALADWYSPHHGYRCETHGRHLRVLARGSDWRRLRQAVPA